MELYEVYGGNPAVTTDSRHVPRGSIFFALRGEKFDGNLFAAQAIEKGAALAVIDNPRVAAEYAGVPEMAGKMILVDDALEALQEVASYRRGKVNVPVLAITGTNGKTTTKELATAVLSAKYRVHFTPGNLNNHIGVPLTLLSMPPETELLVVEMGASARGEIYRLCEIARPGYGLITNIGRAHLEGFGGVEGVRAAKGELYDWLAASGGTAIVLEDDYVLHGMALGRRELAIKYYDILFADGFESSLAGDYNRFNIAAAVAIGRLFGVAERDIHSAIAGYVPSNNRSQKINTGRNTVIADCYNANPSSMAASIRNFFKESATDPGGSPMRKILILGDMFELGQWSRREHGGIVAMALSGDADEVWFVGNSFTHAASAVDAKGGTVKAFPDVRAAAEFISKHSPENSFVMLKGSRGVGLEALLDLL